MGKCDAMVFALLFCLGLSACSMASLDQYGSQVTVLKNPPQNCEAISGIFLGRGPAEQYAMNNLRNIVGEKGGTHVVITGGTQMMQGFLPVGGNSLTIKGLGYKCFAAAGG